jgi:hypothetical protein
MDMNVKYVIITTGFLDYVHRPEFLNKKNLRIPDDGHSPETQ